MITISKDANPNYLAKVVRVSTLKPIEGADMIQIAVVDFQDVVVSKEVAPGDLMVYFPVEGAINKDFLSSMNAFRDKTLNQDKEQAGFFDEKGRVKAIRLFKGTVKSMGYLVPASKVMQWAGVEIIEEDAGVEFDTIGDYKIVEKYKIAVKSGARDKQGKRPKVSRLVEGQVHLHVDTENLRKNAHKIKPEDTISITYKTHGTSWWVSNVLVKRKLSVLERLAKFFGAKVQELEYDLVYGSRKVVKNSSLEDPKAKDHFFGYDLWEKIKDEVGKHIPKGFTLYGEMLGYDHNGSPIQKNYDYGCKPVLPTELTASQFRKYWKDLYNDEERKIILNMVKNNIDISNVRHLDNLKYAAIDLDISEESIYPLINKRDDRPQHKLEVYRITQTNNDGLVTELSYPEIEEFCFKAGLKPPMLMFYGRAVDWLVSATKVEDLVNIDEKFFESNFVTRLEEYYNEKDCFMCVNKVPEEGIVVRKESLFSCESYKLKSFRFLEWESKELDKGEVDIESNN